MPVAQLDRALASGAKGCRFKSCRAYLHDLCLSSAQIRWQEPKNRFLATNSHRMPGTLTSFFHSLRARSDCDCRGAPLGRGRSVQVRERDRAFKDAGILLVVRPAGVGPGDPDEIESSYSRSAPGPMIRPPPLPNDSRRQKPSLRTSAGVPKGSVGCSPIDPQKQSISPNSRRKIRYTGLLKPGSVV